MISPRYILALFLILAAYASLSEAAAHELVASQDLQATLTPTSQGPARRPRATPTPIPTPVPLAETAIASCPVSLPNLTQSPDEDFISAESGYGNPERTKFIGLWPRSTVIFHPDGPGTLRADGSMGMKFWFYRTIPGEVVIEGRRLDESEPIAQVATLHGQADGYGETGFHPAGLRFPGQGCWEVTARIGESRMTFVTLVVWLPFEPLWGSWFPEGMLERDTDITGYPQTIEYIYPYPDGGEIIVGTTQGVWNDLYPDAAHQQLTIQGQEATCVQGDWVEQDWNPVADASVLLWSDEELSYRIRQTGLGLSCQDLFWVAYGTEQDEE